MSKHRGTFVAAGLAGLMAVAPLAGAMDASEDVIKYRQKAMSSLGGHMGAMAEVVRGKVSYKGHMMAHAKGVAGVAAHVTDMFPEGSDFGITDAKMEIWEDWEEFEQKAEDSSEAADELVSAVESGDDAVVAEAFKAVGESCKACHKKFRKEKD